MWTVIKQISSLQTTHYLPGYSAHILTYAYVFGYFHSRTQIQE